jgi:hypothetical protein
MRSYSNSSLTPPWALFVHAWALSMRGRVCVQLQGSGSCCAQHCEAGRHLGSVQGYGACLAAHQPRGDPVRGVRATKAALRPARGGGGTCMFVCLDPRSGMPSHKRVSSPPLHTPLPQPPPLSRSLVHPPPSYSKPPRIPGTILSWVRHPKAPPHWCRTPFK